MKLYQIDYINTYGEREFVAITDDPNKWLKDNNKQRIGDGEEPEKITDFEIHLLFYTTDKKKRKTYKIYNTRSEIKPHIYNLDNKRIEEEDLCDMQYINDAKTFSIFDIRDALNEADNMSLTYKQKKSVLYTLNAFAENYEDIKKEKENN